MLLQKKNMAKVFSENYETQEFSSGSKKKKGH